MKIVLVTLLLAGCASQQCAPLPEPPDNATKEQIAAYAQKVVTMYGDCAGGKR